MYAPAVLVAEDKSFLRKLLEDGLNHEGFRVFLASDGVQAIEIYREHRNEIDLILLDVHMPRFNGLDAWGAIRAINPKAICGLMNGGCSLGKDAKPDDFGVAFILQKPFSVQQVARTLHHVYEGR